MSEAVLSKDANANAVDLTAEAAIAPNEVLQLPDGRAAVKLGLASAADGDPIALATRGQFTVAKTSGVVVLKGAPLYWDRSANSASPLRAAAGADFFLGVSTEDVASTTTSVVVDLNVEPSYTIDIFRDPTDTVVVLTAGTPALQMCPGHARLYFSATAEAQKVDILSLTSIPVTVPFIVEGRCTIKDNGDAAALDFNIGVANGTHATDADSITESLFIHLDGNDLNLDAESDDGTTEVAATDTTVDAVEGTYFDFAFDCRDLSDIKIYINGVRVLSTSTFKLDAATGPLCLLVHLEKTSDDTPGEVRVEKLALRAMDFAE